MLKTVTLQWHLVIVTVNYRVDLIKYNQYAIIPKRIKLS